jgi:hypothetical protein
MESSTEALQNTKVELPYDPGIPLLGIYLKECKSGYNTCTCIPIFIAALVTIAKVSKRLRCPRTDELIKKK